MKSQPGQISPGWAFPVWGFAIQIWCLNFLHHESFIKRVRYNPSLPINPFNYSKHKKDLQWITKENKGASIGSKLFQYISEMSDALMQTS